MWLIQAFLVPTIFVYMLCIYFPPLIDIIMSTYTNMQCLVCELSLNSMPDLVSGTKWEIYTYMSIIFWKGGHNLLKDACFGHSKHPMKNESIHGFLPCILYAFFEHPLSVVYMPVTICTSTLAIPQTT